MVIIKNGLISWGNAENVPPGCFLNVNVPFIGRLLVCSYHVTKPLWSGSTSWGGPSWAMTQMTLNSNVLSASLKGCAITALWHELYHHTIFIVMMHECMVDHTPRHLLYTCHDNWYFSTEWTCVIRYVTDVYYSSSSRRNHYRPSINILGLNDF